MRLPIPPPFKLANQLSEATSSLQHKFKLTQAMNERPNTEFGDERSSRKSEDEGR